MLQGDKPEEILHDVRDELLINIDSEIKNWKENYSTNEDPSEHFEPLKSDLSTFAKALAYDVDSVMHIAEAMRMIDEAVAELGSSEDHEPDYEEYYRRDSDAPSAFTSRSIFDDVAE